METEERKTEEYTESDGTRVIKTTIIRRITPAGNSNNNAKSGGVFNKIFSSKTSSTVEKTPTTTSAPVSSNLTAGNKGDFDEFEQEFLEEHNRLRAKHGVPPLQLSKEVSQLESVNLVSIVVLL